MRSGTQKPAAPLWKRLLWFAAIWAGSVTALGLVAAIIRAVLHP
ncbi:MAG TPA: DUF2474 domain-containing protein [Rhizorhapis sp.]|nr:DUF2474 domain-containing protein [Rhizorhapis sp.]